MNGALRYCPEAAKHRCCVLQLILLVGAAQLVYIAFLLFPGEHESPILSQRRAAPPKGSSRAHSSSGQVRSAARAAKGARKDRKATQTKRKAKPRVSAIQAKRQADAGVSAAPSAKNKAESANGATPSATEMQLAKAAKDGPNGGCHARLHSRAVAIYLVGVRQRLILNSTLQHVVKPIVDDGFAAHLYIALILNVSGTGNWKRIRERAAEDHALATLSASQLRAHLGARTAEWGGCLVHVATKPRPITIDGVPENPGQIQQYPPVNTTTGRRLLSTWFLREMLWNRTLRRERTWHMQYLLAMWVRDDAFWMADIGSLSKLLAAPKATRSVWSRNCGSWGGINDKTVIVGRQAAGALLQLFSGFMKGGVGKPSKNAEVYLLHAVRAAGLERRRVTFNQLPEASAMLVGDPPRVCILNTTWCGGRLRRWGSHLEFCETLVNATPSPMPEPQA
mmetsp:Transcript_9278/g.26668  ORF Transcript_9278/g.26668 Transcript_9278/m.26668 type:complete len:451 (-) Transcript_9278:107-1459(-)